MAKFSRMAHRHCWCSVRRDNVALRGADRPALDWHIISAGRKADWYARRVGVAAAREINDIPARRPSDEESMSRRAAGIRATSADPLAVALDDHGRSLVFL